MSISQRTLDNLYTSRTQRLKRMISAQMPRHMIVHECRLVIESCTGGTKLSAIRWLIGVALSSWWNVSVVVTYQWLFCRLLRLHTFETMALDDNLDPIGDGAILQCAFCPATKKDNCS